MLTEYCVCQPNVCRPKDGNPILRLRRSKLERSIVKNRSLIIVVKVGPYQGEALCAPRFQVLHTKYQTVAHFTAVLLALTKHNDTYRVQL